MQRKSAGFWLVRLIFARKQAACQRATYEQANFLGFHQWHHFPFDIAARNRS